MSKPAATFGFKDVDPSVKAGLVRGVDAAAGDHFRAGHWLAGLVA